jgi:hypothetical protein
VGRYLNEFLKLKCSGDVLNVVGPMNRAEKEISESMAVIKHLKSISLSNPMEYTLYDMCAGNALTSVIASYLLPFKNALAIDKRFRNRDWDKVQRFNYLCLDLNNFDIESVSQNSVIIGIHACGEASRLIIDIYNKSKANYLVLMPCCVGNIQISVPQVIREAIGKYLIWCWDLASVVEGKVSLKIDNSCLSPCNGIIVAHKGDK